MKKILFVLPTLNGGGAERVVLNLLRHLDKNKYKITLFLFKNEGVYREEIPKNIRIVIATSWGHRYLNIPWVFIKLCIQSWQHNIIIAGLELLPTYLSYFAGLLCKRPVIGWVHIAMYPHVMHSHLRKLHEILIKIVYPNLTRIIFVSKGCAESLKNLLSNKKLNNYDIIPNILDFNIFKIYDDFQIINSQEHPVVVGMGRLCEQKGFDILIKAHALVIEMGIKHNLLILGDGPLRRNLVSLSKELGVSDTVFMPGFILNPIPALKSSTLFVLSSRYEGFGMVLLEALAAGLPVIATDCISGPAEILENGKYGILVPPENPQALAEAIFSILTKPSLLLYYKEKASQSIINYMPDKVIIKWDQLFEDIIFKYEITTTKD